MSKHENVAHRIGEALGGIQGRNPDWFSKTAIVLYVWIALLGLFLRNYSGTTFPG